MTPLEKLGSTIRLKREEMGISQEQLAELSGLHRTYVSSIERGERNLSLLNCLKITKALKIKPSKLMKCLD